jgi:hypothetical protein
MFTPPQTLLMNILSYSYLPPLNNETVGWLTVKHVSVYSPTL